MDTIALAEARNSLVHRQLIAYRKPLYQVMALDNRKESLQTDSDVSQQGRSCSSLPEE